MTCFAHSIQTTRHISNARMTRTEDRCLAPRSGLSLESAHLPHPPTFDFNSSAMNPDWRPNCHRILLQPTIQESARNGYDHRWCWPTVCNLGTVHTVGLENIEFLLNWRKNRIFCICNCINYSEEMFSFCSTRNALRQWCWKRHVRSWTGMLAFSFLGVHGYFSKNMGSPLKSCDLHVWEHLGRQMNNRVTLTSVSQHLLVSLIPHSLIKSHRLFRDPLNISHLLQELWLEKRPLPCIYPHIYLCFCLFSLNFVFHDSFGIKFGLLSEVKVGCGTWGNQNM